jgi:AAA+ superfamily predicted ATPase
MNATIKAKSELYRLIRSRCPIIGVETPETRRFMEAAVDIIDEDAGFSKRRGKARKQLFSFSVTRGLSRVATKTAEFEIGDRPALLYDEQPVLDPTPDPAASAAMITQIILENDAAEDPPRIYLLKDVHEYFGDALFVRGLRDLAEVLIKRHQTIILVSPDLSGLPAVLRKDVRILTWPLPGVDELESQIDAFCANPRLSAEQVQLNGTKRELAEALKGLTMNEADQVIAQAMITHGVLDERALEFVVLAKAEIIKQSGALEFYPPDVSLGDVGGLDNLQRWLALAGRTQSVQAKEFGIKPARGVLVVGVPGCGKSLTAKAVSKLWNAPLLRLDVGALFGSLVGQSEGQARNALQVASAIAPAILWIDEIEKGLSSQGGELDGGTAKRVLGTILTWMEEQGSGVFVFATANDIAQLRPELVRRFTEVFFVDLPADTERRTIFEIHLRKSKRDPQAFNLDEVVKISANFTGAEIEEAVQSALWLAFEAGNDVTEADLAQACQETVPLVTTMGEQIQEMRKWASRARPASIHQQTGRQAAPVVAKTRADALEL